MATLYENLDASISQNKKHWLSLIVYDTDDHMIYPLNDPKANFDVEALKIEKNLLFEDESFGRLIVYANWDVELEEKKYFAKIIIGITLSIFSLVALLSLIWQTIWIRKPIIRLNMAASQLKEENYDAVLPPGGKDEIGILTNTFDNMRTTIKESKYNLQEAYKTALENEHKFRSILESTPDPILTINVKGLVTTMNKGVEHEFGYSFKDLVYQPVAHLLTEETAKTLKHYLEFDKQFTYPITIDSNINLFAIHRDGQQFPVEISVNTMEINHENFFILVIRNITERKKNEKLKNDFISTVSHELRTPLTAMNGSIGLLHHKNYQEMDEGSRELLNIAERNLERLLLLINDILDISKLESGKMEFEFKPVSVMEFIEQAINVNQSYAEKHQTQFILIDSVDKQIMINTDQNRLMQVLSNLMSNAAKFNNNEKPVEISVCKNENDVTVRVKDHGAGIPDEFKAHLFEKFTQASSGNTRGVGGTGLGLNISRAIIRNLGGSIDFVSSDGEGSTFFFTLPVYK